MDREAENNTQQPTLLQGRYRLIQQIGSGGFSSVERAEDTLTGQTVAIKCISLHGLRPQEIIDATDTFNREVDLLSRLSHPRLPHIYDRFSDAEHWYVVIDWIDGETLQAYYERCTSAPKRPGLPLEEIFAIGLQLCDILTYLHTRQPPIIYRDLKPGNIMRTRVGELYLIDFGIARRLSPGKRRDTIPLGSPGYAAPEQYGTAQTLPQSDLYSLGAVLYFLLSGNEPPIQLPFPLAPGNYTYLAQYELEALITRLLEHDMGKRPESAATVKQELVRIVRTHFPPSSKLRCQVEELFPSHTITPTPATRPQAVSSRPRHTRRNALITLGTFGLAATCYLLSRHPAPQISSRDTEPTPTPAIPSPPPQTPEPSPTPQPTPYDKRTRFTCKSNFAAVVIWSPDSQRFAFMNTLDSISTVQVLSIGKVLHQYTLGNYLSALAWSPDGNAIAIGDTESAHIWRVNQDNLTIATLQIPDAQVQASNATAQASGSVLPSSMGMIFTLAWSPNGKYIAAGSDDTKVHIWDTTTHQLVTTYNGHQDHVYSVSWSPDGQRIVSADGNGVVKVWESAAGKDVLTYQGHQSGVSVNVVQWSPNGKYIASGSNDTTVQVWNASSGQTLYTFRKHTAEVASLSWSPTSNQIVSSGASNDMSAAIYLWNALSGQQFAPPYHGHSSETQSVAWSPNGQYIASACSADQTVQIWTPQ